MGGGIPVKGGKDAAGGARADTAGFENCRNRQDDGSGSRRPVTNESSSATAFYFIKSILRSSTRSGDSSRNIYMPLGQCEQSHVTV